MQGIRTNTSRKDLTKEQQNDLLRGVSRSFYLTLQILPVTIRQQIGLAFLLGRVLDTLSDTSVLLPEQRLAGVRLIKKQLDGFDVSANATLEMQLQGKLKNRHEALLLQYLPQLFVQLEQLNKGDRERIIKVEATLSDCMIYDLTTFPMAESDQIQALKTWEEMDHYTYMAAGCVGEFWTEMSIAHYPQLKDWDKAHQVELGIRLGKGLQVVNLLRDLPRDLRIGRCYLPESLLQEHHLTVTMLLDKNNSIASMPVLYAGINKGLAHFIAAKAYIISIPRRCIRLRLAALWPLLIGLGTLDKLSSSVDWLNVDSVSKVKRSWVYRMILVSLVCVGSNTLIKSWVDKLARKIVVKINGVF